MFSIDLLWVSVFSRPIVRHWDVWRREPHLTMEPWRREFTRIKADQSPGPNHAGYDIKIYWSRPPTYRTCQRWVDILRLGPAYIAVQGWASARIHTSTFLGPYIIDTLTPVLWIAISASVMFWKTGAHMKRKYKERIRDSIIELTTCFLNKNHRVQCRNTQI